MCEDVSTSAAVLILSAIILVIPKRAAFLSFRRGNPCYPGGEILVIPKARSAEEPAVACSARTSPRSPRPTPTLHPNSPERTHAKPRKCHGEANCSRPAPPPTPPGLIFRIFLRRGKPATRRHHQENQPRNLQPQLMQHPSKGPRRRSRSLSRGPHRPAPHNMLPCYPRRYPDLSCRRNLAHGLDFNSLRSYNGASSRPRSNPSAAAGI